MAVVSACAGGVTGIKNNALETDVNFGLPPSASPTPFVSDSPAPATPAAAAPAPNAPAPVATVPPASVLPPASMITPVTTSPPTSAPVSSPTPKPRSTGQPPIVGSQTPIDDSPTSEKCPVAPYGSSAKAITIDVTTTPPVGSYREIATTTQTVGTVMIKNTTYLTMDVTNVSAVSSLPNPVQGGNTTTFTYDTVLHFPSGATETITWQVKNNSPYRNESAGNVTTAVGVGEPDRGIAIESIVLKDKTGATAGSSSYTPGVLEQPLPVDVGQSFTGEGADTDGGTNAFDGQELNVKHIDACGTLVDGYEDMGTQVITNQNTQSNSTLDVAFATNLGGLFTYMSGVDPVSDTTETLQLGQGTPSPLGTDRS